MGGSRADRCDDTFADAGNMVSSPAPPTNLSILVRTVTRAWREAQCQSFAIAAMTGVSIILGLTDSFTASRTSRPARSMPVAFSKEREYPPFCGDQRVDHPVIASCQIVRFQLIRIRVEPCFDGLNERNDDLGRSHLSKTHADKSDDADLDAGCLGGDPKPQRYKS